MRSEEDIAKMMKDLESLTKAEKMLQDMQSKLAESQEDEEDEYHHHQQGSSSELEVDKLREEVEILRGELHRVEVELEDRCWMAPTILQVCVYGISRHPVVMAVGNK
jgi:stromal interaction molecule 1